ncbi:MULTISPECIES: hypothetical protein [unclassified Nocardioides]|uniref:hypothetical protein n=1 Tax=unclassified Nocardioides TaxID=2615069 RepID=UPI0006F1E690|nr:MULTISPECIES: hypothetical protein [unclassified Nocardioides]KQY54568.1 hypothetical protein ASD30_18155 [Nocardioides sp. Root140]KQZ66443.1 hypothetical protein ASD66_23240 [Nocardioides sp. Root151]KRF19643.1 hypothetical protein ASH02_24115 [Nocardioides sp. Soil796]
MRLRSALPVVVCLAALVLTGCDSGDSTESAVAGDPASAPTLNVPEPTTSPTDGPSLSPTVPTSPTSPSTDADVTPGGTVLKYGETATVALTDSGDGALVEYTVRNVAIGKAGPLGRNALVTIEVRAVDDLASALSLGAFDWKGIVDTGEETVFGIEEGCDGQLPVTAAGESGTMCVAMSVPDDAKAVTEVQYSGLGMSGDPIVWKP